MAEAPRCRGAEVDCCPISDDALSNAIALDHDVIPAQAGIYSFIKAFLDAPVRGHDTRWPRLIPCCATRTHRAPRDC